jgi:hypothetical protein
MSTLMEPMYCMRKSSPLNNALTQGSYSGSFYKGDTGPLYEGAHRFKERAVFEAFLKDVLEGHCIRICNDTHVHIPSTCHLHCQHIAFTQLTTKRYLFQDNSFRIDEA